ncbi:MAG: type I-U CRISPR-associated protein Csb2 [Dehalococcoidia bacterium]|nr:type I-U CRISPR-associated protein Csb2 [Dehalococcoidia bacterium]
MIGIKFEFTAKRYHATQWGRHVNEGVPEWPPSPWRILRGMVATWRRTLPEIPSERMVPILETLASEYPKFHLPPASTGHTRHYMPYTEGTRERTTLVIDSFVAICPGKPLFAAWQNLELSDQQRADLGAILRNMPYLGRAESWVEASLASECPEINSMPLEDGALPEGDWEIARTLMPRSPVKLKDLERETSTLRRSGRIDPEGAQWWPYIRKRDCFTEFRSGRRQTRGRGAGATMVRFSMDGNPLPMAFDTLRWGELARRSAMAQYGRRNEGGRSEKLSGKDSSGNPLRKHQHAFYLPTDENGDGRLDHLTIWAPGGLDEKEFRAIVSVNTLKPEARDPVRLSYLAHGKATDFRGVSDLFGESKRWRSLTPYVLPRHTKFRGPKGGKRMVDGPEEQIRREVALRCPDGPRLRDVEIVHNRERIEPMEGGYFGGFRPFEFFRYRRGGGSNGGGAFNFMLEFEAPVSGPIALGFACHYGLGLFVPADS